MKKLIIVIIFMLGINLGNAQLFDKGTSVVQLGVGFGEDYGTPIGASYEYGLSEKIGIGAFLGYSSQSYNNTIYANDFKVSNILLGAKGNYHFYQSNKLDAYAGLLAGYDVATVKWSNGVANNGADSYGGFVLGASVGARYYFTENFGAFSELGFGLSVLNVGISYKL